jgi:hypothetical protein
MERLTFARIVFVMVAAAGCSDGRRGYFVRQNGEESGDGSRRHPWRSISKLNDIDFEPGDTIHLSGKLSGTLVLDSLDAGSDGKRVVVVGDSTAAIDGGKNPAIELKSVEYVDVMNISLRGAGRKEGNVSSGLSVRSSKHILIRGIDVSGFQKSGISVSRSSNVDIDGVIAHENGFAGISISGDGNKYDCQHITVRRSKSINNPGDPTNLTNHSGNGIIAGYCRHVLIEHCVATENGWDMPRVGNGPVGIWVYEADSAVIQSCISYRNRTSNGGEDGGGFDFDGGVTGSVIQYCLSYENEGAAFGLFQYTGASPWRNNTVRYNVSFNDGLVSTARAGIYVWNGSGSAADFTNGMIYNNTIINERGSGVRYATDSRRSGFVYYNNIFVTGVQVLVGEPADDVFAGNAWWSRAAGLPEGNGRTDPRIEIRSVQMNEPELLAEYLNFVPHSSFTYQGIDLLSAGILPGPHNFNFARAAARQVGACGTP